MDFETPIDSPDHSMKERSLFGPGGLVSALDSPNRGGGANGGGALGALSGEGSGALHGGGAVGGGGGG